MYAKQSVISLVTGRLRIQISGELASEISFAIEIPDYESTKAHSIVIMWHPLDNGSFSWFNGVYVGSSFFKWLKTGLDLSLIKFSEVLEQFNIWPVNRDLKILHSKISKSFKTTNNFILKCLTNNNGT